MKEKGLDLTRRDFIIAGSAAIAAPLIMDRSGMVQAAEAETAKTAATGTGKTYYIGHDCMGCQVCRMMCPAGAIDYGDDRNEIDQDKCIHCGTCYNECPISVISET